MQEAGDHQDFTPDATIPMNRENAQPTLLTVHGHRQGEGVAPTPDIRFLRHHIGAMVSRTEGRLPTFTEVIRYIQEGQIPEREALILQLVVGDDRPSSPWWD